MLSEQALPSNSLSNFACTSMDVSKLFLFLFLSFPLSYSTNDCPPSVVCGNNGIVIQFPFSLPPLQPQNCGYPGFNIRCNKQGIPLLNLPSSGDFLIRNINYHAQVLQLYDQSNCIAQRLLELNLLNSPFKAAYYENYTFLSCPLESTRSRFTTIDCLSNSTSAILATSSGSLVNSLITCKIIVTLPIPVSRPLQFDDGFSSDLNEDLELTWALPACVDDCEEKGGFCSFKNSTSREAVCSYNPQKGVKTLPVLKVIALCIALPAISISIFIAAFKCFKDRGQLYFRPNNITPVAPDATMISSRRGLDETTIESYVKVILGESRRLPGLNHMTCPICLSDYHAKDTLRCIPECQHCFHSDCIDEWLRLKVTCPVCRNSPTPARENS